MVNIVHRIGIRATEQQVYQALATVEGIAAWWSRTTTGTSEVGGTIVSRFHNPSGEEMGHFAYEVLALRPGAEVKWRITDGPDEWVGTEVHFDMVRDGEQTIVRFAHRGWREEIEFTAHCSMKWATFLLSLREWVETGSGRPSPHDFKIDNWN